MSPSPVVRPLSATPWLSKATAGTSGGTDDHFHFVYQPLNGNGQIVARVVSVQNTFQWAKAGVMIRESLTPDARNTLMAVTPGAGTTFQRRLNTGALTLGNQGRLERRTVLGEACAKRATNSAATNRVMV